MRSNVELSLHGQKRLLKKLDRLPKKIGKKVLRQAVRAGAKPILKSARSKCPIESGLLKKSLGAKLKSYKGGTLVAIIGPRKGKGGIYKGEKRDPANYSHLVHDGFVDRGGSFRPGNPFLFSAMAENKNKGLAAMRAKLATATNKEWAKSR